MDEKIDLIPVRNMSVIALMAIMQKVFSEMNDRIERLEKELSDKT